MYALLALLPIFAALFLMSKFKVPPPVSLLLALAGTAVLGCGVWGMRVLYVTEVALLGVLKSLDIILIIYGAILLLNILQRTGALESINRSFSQISEDRRIQLIVIGVELVEMSAVCGVLKRREFFSAYVTCQFFQAAFAEAAKRKVVFPRHLRRADRVVDRLLYNDAKLCVGH